jgi:hypothetical protein
MANDCGASESKTLFGKSKVATVFGPFAFVGRRLTVRARTLGKLVRFDMRVFRRKGDPDSAFRSPEADSTVLAAMKGFFKSADAT